MHLLVIIQTFKTSLENKKYKPMIYKRKDMINF